jgi:hypothetical protein
MSLGRWSSRLISFSTGSSPEGAQIVRVLHGARDIDGILFGEGIE